VSPIGPRLTAVETVQNWFLAYLALPILIAQYLVGVLWKRTRPYKASEIDLVTGRKCFMSAEEVRYERQRVANLPIWQRIFFILFNWFDPSGFYRVAFSMLTFFCRSGHHRDASRRGREGGIDALEAV
jgi:hypothetical protein